MEKNCTFSCHGKLTWPLKRRPFKKGKPASSHHQFSSIHQRCLLGWLAIPEIWCRWIIDALWNPTSLFVSSCWFWGWWNFRQLLAQRWFFPPVFGDVVSWHDIRQTTLHTGYDDMTTAGLLSQWKSANIFQFPRKLGWVPVLPGRQSSRESFLFCLRGQFRGCEDFSGVRKTSPCKELVFLCMSRYVWVVSLFGTCHVLLCLVCMQWL